MRGDGDAQRPARNLQTTASRACGCSLLSGQWFVRLARLSGRSRDDAADLVARALAFIVDKPVKREIFAADFLDRVVRHLNCFDHFMKHHLGLRCYGRYMDVVVVRPRKIHLERYAHGVKYLGVVMKPHRSAEDHRPTRAERAAFRGSVSSYLGLLAHYDTYRLRRRLMQERLSPRWLRAARAAGAAAALVGAVDEVLAAPRPAAGHRPELRDGHAAECLGSVPGGPPHRPAPAGQDDAGASRIPGARRRRPCSKRRWAARDHQPGRPADVGWTAPRPRGAGAPRSKPSALRSSSTSGQWIP